VEWLKASAWEYRSGGPWGTPMWAPGPAGGGSLKFETVKHGHELFKTQGRECAGEAQQQL
jgi:hypothetical protein